MGDSVLSRLVAVSNRVADHKGGKPSGGLAVGLLAALHQNGGLWFGWGGKTRQGEPSAPDIVRKGNIEYATIDLYEADFEDYYNGYSNICLWPLCHYMLGFFRFERRFQDAYRRVNALFARKLLPPHVKGKNHLPYLGPLLEQIDTVLDVYLVTRANLNGVALGAHAVGELHGVLRRHAAGVVVAVGEQDDGAEVGEEGLVLGTAD